MAIFLDTCFLTGISHPNDKHYSDSTRILLEISQGKYGLIYTSPYVVSETATLLLIRSNNNHLVLNNFYSYLYASKEFIRLLPWSLQIDELIWNLFLDINKKAKDKKHLLSFVDVSNIVYCRQNQIQNIASYDNHFDGFLIRIF